MSSDPISGLIHAFRSEHDGSRLRGQLIRERVLRSVRVESSNSRHRVHWLVLVAATLIATGVLAANRAELRVGVGEPRHWLEQGTGSVSGSVKRATKHASAVSVDHRSPPPPDELQNADVERARGSESVASAASPRRRSARRPASSLATPELRPPADHVFVGTPPAEATLSAEYVTYRKAHALQFEASDFPRALAEWERYLVAYPAGKLVLEARYNRAVCLIKTGRFRDAERALRPFANGSSGAYRRVQASYLLDALPGAAH